MQQQSDIVALAGLVDGKGEAVRLDCARADFGHLSSPPSGKEYDTARPADILDCAASCD
ncbi:hypothetical protein D3C83_94660 [compost metagenome]